MHALVVAVLWSIGAAPEIHSELVFPLQAQHVHSSCIVECPNGDLLCCWFQGSGERKSSDAAINGARMRKGSNTWSAPFPMADTPQLPDCNPVLFIDPQKELRLFWIAVPAESWEDSLLRFRKARNYDQDGPPEWYWQDDIILKPGADFADKIAEGFRNVNPDEYDLGGHAPNPIDSLISSAKDLSKQQRGWMTRTHLVTLPTGRILLPLYSDGFYVGLMAISDDGGKSWRASSPIPGVALNQPSVVRKRDGSLVAYMRREGPSPRRVMLSTSSDDGETWTVATALDIPNPNASVEAIVLQDGRWVFVYNDTEDGRYTLLIAMSDDEGATWKWRRHLENEKGGSFHYPSVIQTADGLIHVTYTHLPAGQGLKSIKHVAVNAEWIMAGD